MFVEHWERQGVQQQRPGFYKNYIAFIQRTTIKYDRLRLLSRNMHRQHKALKQKLQLFSGNC